MPRILDPATERSGSQQTTAATDPGADAENTERQVRRVLVIAYYFPPMGLSGVQRTAKFVKYLPQAGWQPTVLTCEPGGYFAFDQSLWDEIRDSGIEVIRTRGWDPTRFFQSKHVVALPAEKKRRRISTLSQFVFIPDNKIGWFRSARRAGLAAIQRLQHDLIFATAPPYTAHLIGRSLSKRTGTPLVLDFRDDWIGNPRHVYPTGLHRAANAKLEHAALGSAAKVVVINEVIRRNLLSRNEDAIAPEDISVLSQGFDPEDFQKPASTDLDESRFTILYSGVFYDVQTPAFFLLALADVLMRRAELRNRIEAVFVGMIPDSAAGIIERFNLSSVVRRTGYLPHSEVISHLQRSDVLWMTVGRCKGSETISTSKLFEYFGARKPVLGLVPMGAARQALEQYGASEIAEPDSVSEISAAIERLYDAWDEDRLPMPDASVVDQFDRRHLTQKLGMLFDGILADRRRATRGVRSQFGPDALSSQ